MTSSLSLRPHTLGCSLRHSQLFQQHYPWAQNKALCGTQICSIIRSVASDFANRTKASKEESSTNGALSSTITHLDAPEIPVDVLGKGRLVENKRVYRQIFVIRSYEVGFDRTAPIETVINLFQETAVNHAGLMDFVGDGMSSTNAMIQNRLFWIVMRMHIEMERYPAWGDVVQIDTWVSSSGNNGVRRDFLVRDYATGETLGRSTSTWALMNRDTRKLSKMPEEVRAEISPQFLDRTVMNEDDHAFTRIPLLDDSAPFRSTGLLPKFHDLDMNQHVNHVKYIHWVLESVPQSLLTSCELSRVTLEYRRECGSADTLESLAQSDMAANFYNSEPNCNHRGPVSFTHLLRLCGSSAEVLRGRTQWKFKQQHHEC